MGVLSGCNDFGDVNVDPEHPNASNMDYKYLFTGVQAQISGSDWDIWRTGLIYSSNMMQQTTSVGSSYGVFYLYSEGYASSFWDNYYSGGRAAIRNVIDVINHWKGDVSHQYEYQYARVMRAYLFQRMTDMYGDVPYSEAGAAYLQGIGKPKYDKQQDIYTDLLKELDEVNTALKALPISTTSLDMDVIYKGDSEKWRKFANSLMLRVAVRLSKIDSETASKYAQKALNNDLFASANEEAILPRTNALVSNDTANPFGKILSQEDSQKFYLSEYFVKNLKEKGDPRLYLLGTKITTPETRWSDGGGYDYGSSDNLDSIIGMPIGYRSSGDFSILKWDSMPQKYKDNEKLDWRPYFALVNRTTFARPDGPSMLVTYAQNCFLLADAAANNLIPGGTSTAKTYFQKGIEAAMTQYNYYTAASLIYSKYLSSESVAAYVKKRLIAFDTNPLKEINWEYYVLSFGDPYETFANWRRSGYPELKSVYAAPYNRPVYPGSVTTEIPRRFPYPTSETTSNQSNYEEAVFRLTGGDKMSSRVWWDK